LRDGTEPGRRPLFGHARAQTADEAYGVPHRIGRFIEQQRSLRQPHLREFWKLKIIGHHAGDHELLLIEANAFTGDRSIARETRAP